MDITSVLGLVLGVILVFILGVKPANLMNFWDRDSIFIVVGGTAAAVIASYPFSKLKTMLKHTKVLVSGKKYQPVEAIESLVEMAQIARKNGLLALEDKANELKDPFFRQSVLLIVDAMEAEKIRDMLESSLDNLSERHDESAAIYDKASAFAPAFGMIGTLVGLINMLKNMNLDSGASSSIGEDMSVALITTFYGCILANLVFMPISNKLRIRNGEELLYKQIIIEGVLGIQTGDNPKNLKERLVSFLDQKQQDKLLEQESQGGEGDEKGKKKEKKAKAPKAKK